jgi:hypothetical protein
LRQRRRLRAKADARASGSAHMVIRTLSFELNWLRSSCRRPRLDLVGDISVPPCSESIRSLLNGQIAGVSEEMISERLYTREESGPIADPALRCPHDAKRRA